MAEGGRPDVVSVVSGVGDIVCPLFPGRSRGLPCVKLGHPKRPSRRLVPLASLFYFVSNLPMPMQPLPVRCLRKGADYLCVCTGSCVCVSGRESVSVGCQEVLPPRTRVRSAQPCLRCCLLTLSGGDVTHCHIVPPQPFHHHHDAAPLDKEGCVRVCE